MWWFKKVKKTKRTMKLKDFIAIHRFVDEKAKVIEYFKIDVRKPKVEVDKELAEIMKYEKKDFNTTIVINGKKYKVYNNIKKIPYENWCAFASVMNMFSANQEDFNDNIPEILSCFVKDCDSETIKEMEYADAMSITFFLSKNIIKFLKNIQTASLNMAHKQTMDLIKKKQPQ